jgi:hypothetical protein
MAAAQQQVKNGMCCEVDVCVAPDVKAQRPGLGKGLVAGSVALRASGSSTAVAAAAAG